MDPVNGVERFIASGEEREGLCVRAYFIYDYVAADMAHICWSGRSATEPTHVFPLLT